MWDSPLELQVENPFVEHWETVQVQIIEPSNLQFQQFHTIKYVSFGHEHGNQIIKYEGPCILDQEKGESSNLEISSQDYNIWERDDKSQTFSVIAYKIMRREKRVFVLLESSEIQANWKNARGEDCFDELRNHRWTYCNLWSMPESWSKYAISSLTRLFYTCVSISSPFFTGCRQNLWRFTWSSFTLQSSVGRFCP